MCEQATGCTLIPNRQSMGPDFTGEQKRLVSKDVVSPRKQAHESFLSSFKRKQPSGQGDAHL